MPATVSIMGELALWLGAVIALGSLLILARACRRLGEANERLADRLIALSSPYPAEELLKMQRAQVGAQRHHARDWLRLEQQRLELAAAQWQAAADQARGQAPQAQGQHAGAAFEPYGRTVEPWEQQEAS